MEIKARHLGSIAAEMPESGGIEVDVGALIARLILFDKVVLESNRLKEVPALISVFGSAGLLELMDDMALEIICDVMTIGEIGQTATLASTAARGGPLPFGSFRFASVSAAYRRDFVHRVLQEVDQVPLHVREQKRLRRDLADRLLEYPRLAGENAVEQTEQDLRDGHPVLNYAIRRVIQADKGVDPGPLHLNVEELANPGDFQVSVPTRSIQVEPKELHELVKRGLLNVAGLNQRIQLMHSFQATTGFKEDESELFRARLGVLASYLQSDAQPARFGRVVALAGVPDLNTLAPGISATKLLRLRESDAVVGFRKWLASVDTQSDDEIGEVLAASRSQLAGFLQGGVGRVLRFVVATASGLHPEAGVVVGPTISAIDTFLLDHIVGKPGPATFLGREYRSIFVEAEDRVGRSRKP